LRLVLRIRRGRKRNVALTSVEQNKIVQLLGYGGKILQPGSVIYNKIWNDRLNQLPPETEHLVRSYLEQVAAIETQLFAAPARLAAKKVADIDLNNREMEDLRRERRRISKEIAVHLDIPYSGPGCSSSVRI
jgi:hypothetical protein